MVVYTEKGDVLLLHRADVPGFWQSVTGSLEPGENTTQAAIRELQEETGLLAVDLMDHQTSVRFPIRGAWRARYAPEITHNEEHWFSVCVADRVSIALQPDEHSEYRWMQLPDAVQLATSPTNRQALEELVNPSL